MPRHSRLSDDIGMRLYRLAFPTLLAICATSTLVVRAQTTEADLTARFVGHPTMLRGLWRDDKLRFDGAGKPEHNYAVGSFTVACVEVDKVQVRGDQLKIEGHRDALVFQKDGKIARIALNDGDSRNPHRENISVEIRGKGTQDFGPALDAIFTEKLGDLIPLMPDFWQTYAHKHFEPQPAEPTIPAAKAETSTEGGPAQQDLDKSIPLTGETVHIGGGVRPPKVLYQADAEFSEEARRAKHSGHIQVYLWVDEAGMPSHVQVWKPAGAGLDEQAIAAVKKYRFKPATRDDVPVKVDLYIEVDFQIF